MSSTDAVAAVERVLAAGGEADEVLRAVAAALHEECGYAWAGISFVEEDGLVLGPHAGSPRPEERLRVPVAYRGDPVAELVVDGADEAELPALERVAELVAAHCLVGWDTGGEPWKA
jgi:hypothetical protein